MKRLLLLLTLTLAACSTEPVYTYETPEPIHPCEEPRLTPGPVITVPLQP